MDIQITKNSYSTCTGTQILKITLPKLFTIAMMEELKAIGFSINESYLKLNMVYLFDDYITITGTFSNRTVSVYCSKSVQKDNKDSVVNSYIDKLSKFFESH